MNLILSLSSLFATHKAGLSSRQGASLNMLPKATIRLCYTAMQLDTTREIHTRSIYKVPYLGLITNQRGCWKCLELKNSSSMFLLPIVAAVQIYLSHFVSHYNRIILLPSASHFRPYGCSFTLSCH